jgi:6-pyruvoyl-tetrahydropterin synthase
MTNKARTLFFTRRYKLSLIHILPEDYAGMPNILQHGHDYQMSITFKRNDDEQILNRDFLDSLVVKNVIEPYDKTLVNESMAGAATGEQICSYIFPKLKDVCEKNGIFGLVSMQLIETRKNFFQIRTSGQA